VLAPAGYTTIAFANLTCGVEAPAPLYLTFGIVENVQGCADTCDTIQGCQFFNSFFDTRLNTGPGVNASTQLTCALFGVPLLAANATNCGPSISDSFGFFKPNPTV